MAGHPEAIKNKKRFNILADPKIKHITYAEKALIP